MKRIEEQIHDALVADVKIVEKRVYPLIMPQDTKKVSVVYSVITDFDVTCMQGSAYSSDVHLQIDVFAPTFKEALEARDQVKYAMKKAFKLFDFFSASIYEPITVKYRQMCDMRITADPYVYHPGGSRSIDTTGISIDSTLISIDMI